MKEDHDSKRAKISSLTEVVEVLAPPVLDVKVGPETDEDDIELDVVSGSRYDSKSNASTQLSGNN